MSILNDLYKIAHATEVPDFDDLDEYLDDDDDLELSKVKTYNYDSIAKQAKDGVMQFPFICTRSLSLETIQMLTKASERNFASLLQVVFNMNQITDTSNPADYIRKFHRNVNDSITGPRDAITFVFNSEIPDAMRRDIMRKVCEGNIVFSDMFEMKTLNEKYMPKDYKMMIALEAKGGRGKHGSKNIITNNTYNSNINFSGGSGGSKKDKMDPSKSTFVPTNLFIDSDVRKANEMQPTLMHVRILHERPTSDKSEYVDFIVGVKATIHPIATEDMIDHLVAILQDRGKMFDFIRWTTGEISLFKDLIFNIDAIKDEIKGVRSGKSSKWWTILKQIKAKRRMNHWTMREPILPNASLVVSMEEADYIKANYGFDILEDETGKKLLNALNIISFSVVDTASEVVHTITDGDSSYTINTFKGLEKDTGNAERQFKDILKAVNKL